MPRRLVPAFVLALSLAAGRAATAAAELKRLAGLSGQATLPHEALTELIKFVDEAEEPESQVIRLLARSEKGSAPANRLKVVWRVVWPDDTSDPEFQKNLRTFYRLIAGAVGICQRARCSDAGGAALAPSLECRLAELRRRIRLPCDEHLSLPALLGHRFALEQLLAELGDEEYLRTRAAELYAEREGSVVTWSTMFEGRPPPLFIDGKHSPGASALEDTRAMVMQLLAAKEAQDLPARARRALKQRVLWRWALPFVAFALAAFYLATYASLGGDIVPTVTAAVAGAAVGRLINLRDHVSYGSQVREILPLFVAQLAIGVATGLVVALAATLPILNLGGPNGVAAFGFAAGFSESTFLKLVSKIAAEPDPDPAPKPAGH